MRTSTDISPFYIMKCGGNENTLWLYFEVWREDVLRFRHVLPEGILIIPGRTEEYYAKK